MAYRLLIPLALVSFVPFAAFAQTVDEPPVITLLTTVSSHSNPAYVGQGSMIAVTLTTSEAVTPMVSINGNPVTMTDAGGQVSFTGSYVVSLSDTEGTIDLAASVTDLGGNTVNATAPTDGATVSIDLTPPTIEHTILSNISFEAERPEGSPIEYELPLGADDQMGPLTAICAPAPGADFTLGVTAVTCHTEDGAGNESESITLFTVTVTDITAPTITIRGDNPLSIELGQAFADPGFYVEDNASIDFTVGTAGAVDTAVAGTYTLTYSATDETGNTATATRTVIVTAPTPPPTSSGGGGGSRRADRDEEEDAVEGEVLGTEDEASVSPEGEVLGASAYHFSRHLGIGDTGEDVRELQLLLKELGYFTLEPTGYYGPVTAQALSAYQTANGLEAVGYVGPKTLALLNLGTLSKDAYVAFLMKEVERLTKELEALTNSQQ